ncbi:MAG: low-specificity L-threonine aldolase [Clostridiales bacterium]|jgi:threonine aldolase|nr:low-specificity L-threonine aldolase [Clostridiales bacterium]
MEHWIDLRSDTVTQPTIKMRQRMFEAEVGDDVYRDDPTVNELERLAADILGKEDALFVPSGTMGNQVALMTHTRRGDEVIAGEISHVIVHEVGAAAVLSGVTVRTVEFKEGVYDARLIAAAIRSDDIHEPPTSLIVMENALANGRVVPEETMAQVCALARSGGIKVHLDGARLFNAALALGVSVKDLTKHCDSVMCCLSKGLCAPVGSVLAGSGEFISRARKNRKMLGGGMRQAGFLAAAGIVALREMPARLKEDHDNAKYLAERLAAIPGLAVDMDAVEINMVFFTLNRPAALLAELPGLLREKGIKINGFEGTEGRFVTHYGLDRADIDFAVDALAGLVG